MMLFGARRCASTRQVNPREERRADARGQDAYTQQQGAPVNGVGGATRARRRRPGSPARSHKCLRLR